MENTLKRLNINLNESQVQSNQRVDNIDGETQDKSVDNDKDSILVELQEALNSNQKLENKIVQLQEKLSACYTRESEQEDEITKYKNVISKLVPSVEKVKALEEKLSKVNSQLNIVNDSVKNKDERIYDLTEKLSTSIKIRKSLKESVNKNVNELKDLQADYNNQLNVKDEKIKSLNESLSELQKDLNLTKSDYSSKIDKANKLIEKYKKIANKAVDRYIESQALKLGVNENEIKNKLPASYTFDDIDTICENLQEYKLSMNKLPFRTLPENYNMKVTSPKPKLPIPAGNFDDDVDEGLISLAGLK